MPRGIQHNLERRNVKVLVNHSDIALMLNNVLAKIVMTIILWGIKFHKGHLLQSK